MTEQVTEKMVEAARLARYAGKDMRSVLAVALAAREPVDAGELAANLRGLCHPFSEAMADGSRLIAFVKAGNAAADALEAQAREITAIRSAIDILKREIFDLTMERAELIEALSKFVEIANYGLVVVCDSAARNAVDNASAVLEKLGVKL